MASPLVGLGGARVTIPAGRRFWKMSGSGNDFLFFDAREQPPGDLETPERIDRLCARGTGFRFATDAGVIAARLSDGIPEIDLQPVRGLRPEAGIALAAGESRMGFADSGVPHLVVLVEELDSVDVVRRGRALRNHPSLPEGANVNFVTPVGQGRWRIRTYERGVEAETLACGTGSVATGVLLEAWRLSGARTSLQTRSGRILTATVSHHGSEVRPSLRGEGRIVFLGELGEV